jgi:sulfur-carrier protein adenylyltransferase/sulfurtransferase
MGKTAQELMAQARTEVPELTPSDVHVKQEAGENIVVLDVRDANELRNGCVPGSLCISRGMLEFKIDNAVARDRAVVVMCAGGMRSLLAAKSLRDMGYTDVASMAGGFGGWKSAGYPVEGCVGLFARLCHWLRGSRG